MSSNKKTTLPILQNFIDIAEQKKIEISIVKDSFVESLKHVIENVDPDVELEFNWNDKGKLIVTNNKIVVSKEEYDDYSNSSDNKDLRLITFANIEDLKGKYPNVQVDDNMRLEINYDDLSGARVQKLSALLNQNLAKATKERIYRNYLNRIGESVKVKITSIANNYLTLKFLDDEEVITSLRIAEILKADPKFEPKADGILDVFIVDVLQIPKKNGHAVLVSKTSPYEILDILKRTYSEIASKEIIVKRIARRAGERAKVAVMANPDLTDSSYDPISILIGKDGLRSQLIATELKNETIDFIKWTEDRIEFLQEALKPARIISIDEKKEAHDQFSYEIVVPNAMVSVAIGKFGINAGLASDITRSKITIKSYSDALEADDQILWNANVTKEELAELNEFSATKKRVRSDYAKNSYGNFKQKFDVAETENAFREFDSYMENFEGEQIEFETASKTKGKQNKPRKEMGIDIDALNQSFDMISAELEADSDNDFNIDLDSDIENEQAKFTQADKRIAKKYKNYSITDESFADFANDGIDFEEFDDLDDEDDWDE
ncbi:NusA antitermination factor [Mycoplasma testudineum]|uniref:NusA antitermination factor n=1 Tax=Mycoplasma testudineum TaxID=244584 RepID=A0A4R6IDW5_9MOLU|nr:hypothetical protein [Mycoplasma testudineum]OYD26914.1 hypothetical protein CG473_01065 [Mycoplasma testudineum]TDO20463.1 NusA antitermination factor [Mycoplasma testudineum]